MKTKKTESYNVQVNKNQLEEAKRLVNLPDAIREFIAKLTHSKICPACGSKLEGRK